MTGARFKPLATPETQQFWDGTQQHQLLLQQCESCNTIYFPPRPFCPHCSERRVRVLPASGRATLYSYVISHRPAPGFEPPFSIAVVTLEEGPRLMTNVVGCPQTPEVLVLDMPLEVVFEKLDDTITLPLFRPAQAAVGGGA